MRTAAVLAVVVLAAPALARDVSGVEVPDRETVAGQELRLNGVGVRKKLWIEVYVGALYVTTASADGEAIVGADAPKRVRMVFLRDVDRKAILGAFRDGFEANSRAQLAALERDLERIGPAIGDVKKGGEIVVTYVPGEGTTVIGPAGTVTVQGKAFADALFRNWIGAKPADGDLKKRMLGR